MTTPVLDISLTGPGFAAIVTGVGECVISALSGTPGGEPSRQCLLVPTQLIAWDNCDCGGQYAAAIQQVYASERFPQPFVQDTWAKCKPRWWVAQVVVSVTRCVPAVQEGGAAPDCDDVLTAALQLEMDRTVTRQAIACCLQEQYAAHTIGSYALGASVTVGEQGGCAGSETTFWVAVNRCPC